MKFFRHLFLILITVQLTLPVVSFAQNAGDRVQRSGGIMIVNADGSVTIRAATGKTVSITPPITAGGTAVASMSDLTTAIAAANAAPTVPVLWTLTQTVNVTSNQTIPANVTIQPSAATPFTTAAGVDLTILGDVISSKQKIFPAKYSTIALPTMQVGQLVVNSLGSGYAASTTQSITFFGCLRTDGTAATGTATVNGSGQVVGTSITSPGSGYVCQPFPFVGGGDGNPAHAASLSVSLSVASLNIVQPGAGYTTAPTVTITNGGGGLGATATATISGGQVNALTVTGPGTFFTGVPTVSFTSPGRVIFASNNNSFAGSNRTLRAFQAAWWGVVGDGPTDDTIALESALANVQDASIITLLGHPKVKTTNASVPALAIVNRGGLILSGAGNVGDGSYSATPSTDIILDPTSAAGSTVLYGDGYKNSRIANLVIEGGGVADNLVKLESNQGGFITTNDVFENDVFISGGNRATHYNVRIDAPTDTNNDFHKFFSCTFYGNSAWSSGTGQAANNNPNGLLINGFNAKQTTIKDSHLVGFNKAVIDVHGSFTAHHNAVSYNTLGYSIDTPAESVLIENDNDEGNKQGVIYGGGFGTSLHIHNSRFGGLGTNAVGSGLYHVEGRNYYASTGTNGGDIEMSDTVFDDNSGAALAVGLNLNGSFLYKAHGSFIGRDNYYGNCTVSNVGWDYFDDNKSPLPDEALSLDGAGNAAWYVGGKWEAGASGATGVYGTHTTSPEIHSAGFVNTHAIAHTTLTANKTLVLNNLVGGSRGTLAVTQNATGGWVLTLPGVISNGGTINPAMNSTSVLKFDYDGTTVRWQVFSSVTSGAAVNPTSGTLPYNNAGSFVDSLLTQNSSKIGINVSGAPSGELQVKSGAAGTIPVVVQHAASPTSDFTQWRNSSGTPLLAVNNVGALQTKTANSTDLAGSLVITVLGGDPDGSASFSFAGTYATPPICVASSTTSSGFPVQVTTTTSALTVTAQASMTVNYICIGLN